jgi:hypothetical protein
MSLDDFRHRAYPVRERRSTMKRVLLPAAGLWIVFAVLAPAGATGPVWHYGDMNGASLGLGADLNGAVPFPETNAWNTDISKEPVDPNSAALIDSIGSTIGLHPDFGSGTYQGAIIGIPYIVVSKAQPFVPIVFTAYGDQSNPGPYPVPHRNDIIEGYMPDGMTFGGDRHVIVIDRDTNRLYEMWSSYPQPNGKWKAGSGARFVLSSNNVRPGAQPGWTSADAAGLPIFPGLVRYDEIAAGVIPHALRFTVEQTREAYVPPANHWASDSPNRNLPPMGMRVRLRASYRIPASFSRPTRIILTCLQKYGMMVADNGSSWFISGAPDRRWNNNLLVNELRQVSGANFEVVRMVGVVTP